MKLKFINNEIVRYTDKLKVEKVVLASLKELGKDMDTYYLDKRTEDTEDRIYSLEQTISRLKREREEVLMTKVTYVYTYRYLVDG